MYMYIQFRWLQSEFWAYPSRIVVAVPIWIDEKNILWFEVRVGESSMVQICTQNEKQAIDKHTVP